MPGEGRGRPEWVCSELVHVGCARGWEQPQWAGREEPVSEGVEVMTAEVGSGNGPGQGKGKEDVWCM